MERVTRKTRRPSSSRRRFEGSRRPSSSRRRFESTQRPSARRRSEKIGVKPSKVVIINEEVVVGNVLLEKGDKIEIFSK